MVNRRLYSQIQSSLPGTNVPDLSSPFLALTADLARFLAAQSLSSPRAASVNE